jgi:hypothetical protein
MIQGRGTGRLITGNAQGPYQRLAIAPVPVGDCTVTALATEHGHAHERQHGGQGMASTTGMVRVRNIV